MSELCKDKFLRIWSHLLKKSLMENFIFCSEMCGKVPNTPLIISFTRYPFVVIILFNTGLCKSAFSAYPTYSFGKLVFRLSMLFVLFLHFSMIFYAFMQPVLDFEFHVITFELSLFADNKAKGRISKRVFQENKARQIFRKMNISYPLIRTRTSTTTTLMIQLKLYYTTALF